MSRKRSHDDDLARLDELIEEITVDAYGDVEQLWAFRQAFEDKVELPADAYVIGEPVSVVEIDYDGNERRGLTARCRREDGSEHEVAASDVVFPEGSIGCHYMAAYREWLGLAPYPAGDKATAGRKRQHKAKGDELDLSGPVELVALSGMDAAEKVTDNAPCSPPRSGRQVSGAGASEEAEGTDHAPIEPKIDWNLASAGVPTDDVLDGLILAVPSDLDEAIAIFKRMIEEGTYLTWEAIILQEQGLSLTDAHEERLDDLISFSDCDEEERILYINEIARPPEAWYETLRRLAPRMLVPVLRTSKVYYDGEVEGWREVRRVLEEHAENLSLPPGVETPLEVIPASCATGLICKTVWRYSSASGRNTRAAGE